MSLFLDTFKIVIYDALGKIGLLQEVYRYDEHIISYHKQVWPESDIPTDIETILNSVGFKVYYEDGTFKCWATGSLPDGIDEAAGVA